MSLCSLPPGLQTSEAGSRCRACIYVLAEGSPQVQGSYLQITFSLQLLLGLGRGWGKGTVLGPLPAPSRAQGSSQPAFAAGETAQGENEKLGGAWGRRWAALAPLTTAPHTGRRGRQMPAVSTRGPPASQRRGRVLRTQTAAHPFPTAPRERHQAMCSDGGL